MKQMKRFGQGMKTLCALIFMLFIFSGCQLAQEFMQREHTEEDAFVGFFVTFGHFSLEGAFDANDRIYAEREGEYTFIFPVEGIPFFVGTVQQEGEHGGGSSWVTFGEAGPGIISDTMHIHAGDDFTRRTLSGTLHVTPQMADTVYVFNPVYQTPGLDGRIYISRFGGSAVSVAHGDGAPPPEGRVHSFSHVEERATQRNGVTFLHTTTVELAVANMHPPERIVIMQMDANHQALARAEYAPDNVPEEFTPLPGTAYLIVETLRAAEVTDPVLRALYGTNDETIAIFYEMGNRVLAQRFVQVNW
jgi:hypothetical protein